MIRIRRWLIPFLCLLFTLIFHPPAWAGSEDSEKLKVTVVPYLWVAWMSGNSTIKGLPASVNVTPNDILENLDFTFMGYLEARKGRWAGFLDGTYMDLGADGSRAGQRGVGTVSADIDFQATILKFGASYRILRMSLAEVPGGSQDFSNRFVTLDFLAGGRYTKVEVDLNLSTAITLPRLPTFGAGRTVSGSQEWVDPIVGLRTTVEMTERIRMTVQGNIGGFGVASDFVTEAIGVLGYSFPIFGVQGTFYGGYRVLDYQGYSNGSGSSLFVWNMTIHGPLFGYGVEF